MKNKSDFYIKKEESIHDNFYQYPEDELNEFSEFEMGLKRFCFDHNCSISIQIDNEKFDLHLYHDFLDALEDKLCEKVLSLQAGNSGNIMFGDYLYLSCQPIKELNEIDCKFIMVGTGKSKIYSLCLSDFLEKLYCFINEILEIAVQENYIHRKDIHEYLGWQL
jgi:hypothetical protein